MKILRVLMIATILVAAFLFITSRTQWGQHRILRPIAGSAGKLWSGPDTARSASLGPDEVARARAAAAGSAPLTATQPGTPAAVTPGPGTGRGTDEPEERAGGWPPHWPGGRR